MMMILLAVIILLLPDVMMLPMILLIVMATADFSIHWLDYMAKWPQVRLLLPSFALPLPVTSSDAAMSRDLAEKEREKQRQERKRQEEEQEQAAIQAYVC